MDRKTSYRVISAILAIMMVATLLPSNIFATDGENSSTVTNISAPEDLSSDDNERAFFTNEPPDNVLKLESIRMEI